jgi:diguanylate cyclase (GGDEF)-like protein/PAS domain S-box-containing protein
MRYCKNLLEMGAHWVRTITQGSTLLGAILIVMVWVGVQLHLESEHTQTERSAIQNSANLASAFEEHLSRTLNEIDRSLKIIRTNYLQNPDKFNLKDWLETSQLFDDQTLQSTIIAPDGLIKQNSGGKSSIGTNLGDREHFRVHVDTETDALFISKPVIGRTTGKWSIQLTRRMTDENQLFAGVIVASLDPAYLARFYSSVDVGSKGYIRVVGTDGIIRAVAGDTAGIIGRDLSRADLFKNYPKAPTGWYYTASNFSDHTARLVTYRAVKNYPLIITIGLATDDIFATVRSNQRTYYLVATVVTILILVVMGFNIRGRRTRERIAAERDLQNMRLDVVMTNMPLGVCMIDGESRVAISNEHYRRMYDFPANAARPGTSFLDIIRHRKTTGTFSGDPETFCRDVGARLAQGSLVKFLSQLDDGRFISVLNQPIAGGGWISIHQDNTEQQLAKVSLERTKSFLDKIIENIPVSIVVKEAATRRFILVNQAYESFVGMTRDQLIGKTVFEIFQPDDAKLIAQCDDEAIASKARLITADISVEPPAKGSRAITTTRLVVCDSEDKPQYLIIVIEDITEKKKAHAKIAFMAHHDPLTGLPNRAQFTDRLNGALVEDQQPQLAVLFLDLDHFKIVNDTMGHLVGDELLNIVADRLKGCLRQMDTVARLGGDEFAIILAGINQPSDVSAFADRIRAAVKAPYDLGGLRAVVDVSIGISCAPNDGTTSTELIKRADLALYKAKFEGRSTYRFFEPEMDMRMKKRREMEVDLRNAILNGEFELFYQPIVNIRNHEITGFEGLLRWHHPRNGIISPGEFIPVAEETGLIAPLGAWVIQQACSDAANWPDDIKIAVNLSPAQFARENLAQTIINALAVSGVSPSRLELEITEEILLAQNYDNRAVLDRLRELGIQIVMDDFGKGYSSLNYLRSFPFDKIKIDRSFVSELASNAECAAIVSAVAGLGRSLNIATVAEGVETEEQLALVQAAGCTYAQGYLFARPCPTSEIDFRLAGMRRWKGEAA